ncbi:MAG: hypothetical protein AB7D36_10720 [Oscillospiraceae bacterium]
MKKTLSLCLMATMLVFVLAGCKGTYTTTSPTPTVSPFTTVTPGTNDLNNGTVKDTDGIITDGDTGTITPTPSVVPNQNGTTY